FGSWAGGDQDGNPNATPDLIPQTLARHRDAALRGLRRRVRALAQDLAISQRMVGVTDELLTSIAADAALMPTAAATIATRNAHEPYRQKLSYMWERLHDTGEAPYPGPADLLADLDTIQRSLDAHRGHRITAGAVARLRRH